MRCFLLLVCLLPLCGSLWAAPVNINTADATTISTNLQGIGLKRAQAIVDYRREHGPFKTLEALRSVKGLGRKMLEKNLPNIRLK